MITKSEVTKKAVVFQNIVAELLDSRFVLEVKITLKEALVQLNDLSESEMLSWSLVQATSSLNELYKILR